LIVVLVAAFQESFLHSHLFEEWSDSVVRPIPQHVFSLAFYITPAQFHEINCSRGADLWMRKRKVGWFIHTTVPAVFEDSYAGERIFGSSPNRTGIGQRAPLHHVTMTSDLLDCAMAACDDSYLPVVQAGNLSLFAEERWCGIAHVCSILMH
jgi:hypothetical protein